MNPSTNINYKTIESFSCLFDVWWNWRIQVNKSEIPLFHFISSKGFGLHVWCLLSSHYTIPVEFRSGDWNAHIKSLTQWSVNNYCMVMHMSLLFVLGGAVIVTVTSQQEGFKIELAGWLEPFYMEFSWAPHDWMAFSLGALFSTTQRHAY